MLRKVVKSAADNALVQNENLDEEALYVSHVEINDAPRMKRIWVRGPGPCRPAAEADVPHRWWRSRQLDAKTRSDDEETANGPEDKSHRHASGDQPHLEVEVVRGSSRLLPRRCMKIWRCATGNRALAGHPRGGHLRRGDHSPSAADHDHHPYRAARRGDRGQGRQHRASRGQAAETGRQEDPDQDQGDSPARGERAADRHERGAPTAYQGLVPPLPQHGGAECNAGRGAGHQDQDRRPARRVRDVAAASSARRDAFRCTRSAPTSTTASRSRSRRWAPSASRSGSSTASCSDVTPRRMPGSCCAASAAAYRRECSDHAQSETREVP